MQLARARFSPILPVTASIRSLFLLGSLFLSVPSARAQMPRVEGTLTQTQNGVSTRANVFWQPPDSLKIEITNAQNQSVQTVLATQNQTEFWNSRTKRRAVSDFNVAKEPFRGWDLGFGGPANFAFSGAQNFVAEKEQEIFWQRGEVLFGGGAKDSYYAAFKTRARRIPAQVAVSPTARTDKNDAGAILTNFQLVFRDGLPVSAKSVGAASTIEWKYDLKARAEAFPDATFALPNAAKTAISENTRPQKPSFFAGESADELWNRGAALWSASGDARGAMALWGQASGKNPSATAPHFSIFDLALRLRDDKTAGLALDKLATLGVEASELDARRLQLAIARRDVGATLVLARTLTPKLASDDAQITLAGLEKTAGELESARKIWRALLADNDSKNRAAQVLAAENLALAASRGEIIAQIDAIPDQTDAQKLARALLQLRGGGGRSVTTFAQNPFLEALARALERAGSDGAAKTAWEELAARGDKNLAGGARSHLVSLAALRGDVTGALEVWRIQNAAFPDRTSQDAAQKTLFEAFQKAFRAENLRAVLSNRAGATAPNEGDLRLWLGWQETYGAPKDAAATVELGATRFPNSAFWQGKRAENQLASAFEQSAKPAGLAARDRLFDAALQSVNDAIKNAPDERFYVLQRASLLVQQVAREGIATANRSVAARDRATRVLADLEQSGDPDFLVAAALGRLTLKGDANAQIAARDALAALDTAPADGDRSTLVFAARQAAARAFDALDDPKSAAQQWQSLFDVVRSASEQASLAGSVLAFYETQKDARAMAMLLARVAGEKWEFEAARSLLSGAATRAAISPLAPAIATALKGAAPNDDAAKIAWASLALARLQRAKVVVAAPGAPPETDAELERATRDLGAALGVLRSLAEAKKPIFSSRAAILLAENSGLTPDKNLVFLENAALLEPGAADVQLALADNQKTEKRSESRLEMARRFDFALELWRSLALSAVNDGDRQNSAFWAREAFNYAQRAPEIDANTFQRIAFMRAKVAFANGETSAAQEIYKGLSSAQWDDFDRAAALLALKTRLLDAGREAQANALDSQITALPLERAELEEALEFLETVEN